MQIQKELLGWIYMCTFPFNDVSRHYIQDSIGVSSHKDMFECNMWYFNDIIAVFPNKNMVELCCIPYIQKGRHWKFKIRKRKKRSKIPKGGNQKPQIGEGQTTQWPKEKGQRDKQWSTKHYTKN